MKRLKFIFAVFLLLGLILPGISYAHGSGFPPFFKIDNKIADPYFLQNAGVFSSNLSIPQDISSKNFSVSEKISFEIDESKLGTVYPPEIMNKIKYKWDFGDSGHATGVSNTHSYKKIGTYILTITADYQDPNTPPQLIESALINVLPENNYQLPQSRIKANNKVGSKQNYNILDLDLANQISFEGSDSISKSSKIVKYTWDFGDDKSANGKNVVHQYDLPQAFATVVLRVQDENGIFADSYVNIRNSGKNDPGQSSHNSSLDPKNVLIGILGILIAVVVVIKIRIKKH